MKLRKEIYSLLINSELLNHDQTEFLNFIHKSEFFEVDINNINSNKFPYKVSEIFQKTKDNTIFQLFPYVSLEYDSEEVIKEIKESINNLKTRLSNLKKKNKSLNDIDNNSSSMTWDELKNITFDLHNNEEILK